MRNGRVSKTVLVFLMVIMVSSSLCGVAQAAKGPASASAARVDLLQQEPFTIEGIVLEISDTSITLDAWGVIYEMFITPDTVIIGEPTAGNMVLVEALEEPGGLAALFIEVLNDPPPPPPPSLVIMGVVQSLSDAQIVVEEPGGAVFAIAITPDTVIIGEPTVGDMVLVEALEEPGGLAALFIEVLNDPPPPPSLMIMGVVQSLSDAQIVVEEFGGAVFAIAITPDTVIIGEPAAGDTVMVQALEEPGGLVALFIEVLNYPPPPPSLMIMGVVQSLSDAQIVVEEFGGAVFAIAITPDTVIIGEPTVGDTVMVEALEETGGLAKAEETGGLVALLIQVMTEPPPPPPGLVIVGVVQDLSEVQIVVEEPGGAVFEIAITPDTVIIGEPSVGDIVLVEALEEPGGLVALLIEVQNSQLAGPVREISNRVQQRAGH